MRTKVCQKNDCRWQRQSGRLKSDVIVSDMWNLMCDHALDFFAIQPLHQSSGDRNRCIFGIGTGRKGVRALIVDNENSRHRNSTNHCHVFNYMPDFRSLRRVGNLLRIVHPHYDCSRLHHRNKHIDAADNQRDDDSGSHTRHIDIADCCSDQPEQRNEKCHYQNRLALIWSNLLI